MFEVLVFYITPLLIVFGVDMSSSVHIDNSKKDILILGKDPTQGLDDSRSLIFS